MGVMTGGAKLDAFLRDMARKTRDPGTLKVGFMRDAVYPDGTPVATVAAIQNYGSAAMGIPPRPFFTNMVRRYRATWPGEFKRLLKATGMDAARTFRIMGEEISTALQEQIVETTSPPLSPVTLMLRSMRIGNIKQPVTFDMVLEARRRVKAGEQPKGLTATGSRPLVWTCTMLASVEYTIGGQRFGGGAGGNGE